LAAAFETWLMKVDLPALGSPTSPASASSLSRSQTAHLLRRDARLVLARSAVGRVL
jgi:hypothetical protein